MKNTPFYKLIVWVMIVVVSASFVAPGSYAADVFVLPNPGKMVLTSPGYVPSFLKGIKIFPDNPLRFDFIVDTGQSKLKDDELKAESTKLIKYFLSALTIPEDDLWVNLSPYEKDRIVPEHFGQTEMGRDLLAQDYLLKQITASLIYPEDEIGQAFWKRVYARAAEKFGTTQIPVNTFNKVWVVPEKAVVYENGDIAYIVESHLKVMLDKDYLALRENMNNEDSAVNQYQAEDAARINDISSEIMRESILPEIEKEVNEGKNFAALRQIYHSMILAAWFKRNLKESLLGKIYVGKNKVNGVDVMDRQVKQKIYQQYLEAFKVGVYNYIKEDFDAVTQEIIPRKYFSGGMKLGQVDNALIARPVDAAMMGRAMVRKEGKLLTVSAGLNLIKPVADEAMVADSSDDEVPVSGKYSEQQAQESRRKISEALRQMDGQVNSREISGRAKVHFNTVRRHLPELFRDENSRRRLEGRPILALRGDLTPMIVDVLQRMPGGKTTRSLIAIEVGISSDRLKAYEWRKLVEEENQRRVREGITLIEISREDTGDATENIRRALRNFKGKPTNKSVGDAAGENEWVVANRNLSELVNEENELRAKEGRPLLQEPRTIEVQDGLAALKEALKAMDGEVSPDALRLKAGLTSRSALTKHRWRDLLAEENIRRSEENNRDSSQHRELLTAIKEIIRTKDVLPKVLDMLARWEGPIEARDLMNKLDIDDYILRNLDYRKLIIEENRRREMANAALPEGSPLRPLITIREPRTTDPAAKMREALRSMHGRVKLPALASAAGVSVHSLLKYGYKIEIEQENTRRKIDEPKRFLLSYSLDTDKVAAIHALQIIEGPYTADKLAEEIGLSIATLTKVAVGELIRAENSRRQEFEMERPLIGWRFVTKDPLTTLLSTIQSMKGKVSLKEILEKAGVVSETAQRLNYRGLIDKENERRKSSDPSLPLIELTQKEPNRNARESIITALKTLEGQLTLPRITQAANVNYVTLYNHNYRELVIKENMRRIQEEPGRPLLILPDTQKTEEEIRLEESFYDSMIEKYNLGDVISGTAEDLEMMYDILLMLNLDLPPEIVQSIAVYSYRGLKGSSASQNALRNYENYTEVSEGSITLDPYPGDTEDVVIKISGKIEGGFKYVQIQGDRQRIVEVNDEGGFSAKIILAKGSKVELTFFGFNDANKTRGAPVEVVVQQTSEAHTPEEVLEDLLRQKKEVRDRVTKNEHQLRFVKTSLELGLLRHFTDDENEGINEIQRRIDKAKRESNEFIATLYIAIKERFQRIVDLKIADFKYFDKYGMAQRPYFYQKYVYDEVQSRKQESNGSLPGVIIALEQGLGKTLIGLMIMRAHENGAIAAVPNAVVTAWGDNEGQFFSEQHTAVITGSNAKTKIRKLKDTEMPIRVVNFEFLRDESDDRFKLMNKEGQIVFIDESQMLSSQESLQSLGARKLKGSFSVLMSGTPFVNTRSIRPVLQFFEQDNLGLTDGNIFTQLFNKGDPESLVLLRFMLKKYIVRIKARHVFKEFDRNIPLEEQENRLPAKIDISPDELGAAVLDPGQEESIFKLFTDWPGWKMNQESQGLSTSQDEELQAKNSDDFFSRMHSLLQIMTFPDYFDKESKIDSPKSRVLDEIVEKEVKELKGKVVISVKYNEEIDRLTQRYKEKGYGVVTYYGETDSEFPTRGGFIANNAESGGRVLNFRKINAHQFAVGEDGRPIVVDGKGNDKDGMAGPMTPKDYNRLVFQNDPTVQIIVTNDQTGGVGITLTAATATVRTNRGRNAIIEDQFEKRINRIDQRRKKYETRHYMLEARYSERFLERMKAITQIRYKDGKVEYVRTDLVTDAIRNDANLRVETVYNRYFAQGTFDEAYGRIFASDRKVLEVLLGDAFSQGDVEDLSSARLQQLFPGLSKDAKKSVNTDTAMPIDSEPSVDKAMLGLNNPDVGGIDLNPNKLDLQTQGEGMDFEFSIDEAMLQSIQIDGFSPVIINIVPTNVPLLLGLREEEKLAVR